MTDLWDYITHLSIEELKFFLIIFFIWSTIVGLVFTVYNLFNSNNNHNEE